MAQLLERSVKNVPFDKQIRGALGKQGLDPIGASAESQREDEAAIAEERQTFEANRQRRVNEQQLKRREQSQRSLLQQQVQ